MKNHRMYWFIICCLFIVTIGCTKKEEKEPLTGVSVFIPNTFTPTTSSGINDNFIWVIDNPQNIPLTFSCVITDNEGITVFKTTYLSEYWTGKMRVGNQNNKGKLLPQNTYSYKLVLSRPNSSQESVFKGIVFLNYF